MSEENHALDNARSWAETILEWHRAILALESGEESATYDGYEYTSEDELRDRAHEMPLSVEYRNGWFCPGQREADEMPHEYRIVLTFGGPALQLTSKLSSDGEPCDYRLMHQDWGTGWTYYDHNSEEVFEALGAFARTVATYYGD